MARSLPHLCAALIAIVVGLLFLGGPDDFCLDDAWIHLSYARSLGLGEGLSYNPHDWETGFSSPLWLLLLFPLQLLTAPVLAVKSLGIALHALAAGLLVELSRRLLRLSGSTPPPSQIPHSLAAGIAGLLFALHPPSLQGATSGMEVSLTTCILLGTTLALITRRSLLGLGLGFAAVLARPESLFFLVPLGGLRLFFADKRSRRSALAVSLGAVAALLSWMAYCWFVTSFPWPNPRYVKADLSEPAALWKSVQYLSEEWLGQETWLVSIGGLVLIASALLPARRERPSEEQLFPRLLFGASLVSLLLIALSRPLHPGILFFESRYFVPFAWPPFVLLALGLTRLRRRYALLCLLPLLGLNTLQLFDTQKVQRDQEASTRRLHREVAQWAASELPPDSRIAVEGAGAMRYFTPRSMVIVDFIGLNDRDLAHANSDAKRACLVHQKSTDYFIAHAPMMHGASKVFSFRPLAHFDDPHFAQSRQPYPVRVSAAQLIDLQPRWVERCQALK